MNSPEVSTQCVAICQLSSQPPEDFNVNTELLVLDDGDVHVSTWDAEPRDGGFDVHVLNDRVDALGFMVITDWEFFDVPGGSPGDASKALGILRTFSPPE
mgnify:CR=1 FL=1